MLTDAHAPYILKQSTQYDYICRGQGVSLGGNKGISFTWPRMGHPHRRGIYTWPRPQN